jgi:predicted TIM-barrel fold metal-dependent hydrolase
LEDIRQAAQAHPSLILVVDHVNLVFSTPSTVDALVSDLLPLAAYENVCVKLSGLPIRSAYRYPFGDLHELLRRVYDAFGPQRLMWGSDHSTTLAEGKASYRENLDLICDQAFRFAPAEDREWILNRTLSERFRWPQAS